MNYTFNSIGYEQYDPLSTPTIITEVEIYPDSQKEFCDILAAINSPSLKELKQLKSMFNLRSALQPSLPSIKNVYFNNPVTVVLWNDGTKTVVKCQKGDTYSRETGLALCIAKKAMGNKSAFNDIFKKWIPEEKPKKAPTKAKTENKWHCLTCKHSNCDWTEAPCNVCEYGNRYEADKTKRKKQSR